MKKNNRDLRSSYNFSSMKRGVRGKYAASYRTSTNLVLLDPDVAQAFPTDASVNRTLRAVLNIANDLDTPRRTRNGPRRTRGESVGRLGVVRTHR
ncbi:MAG TPA: hypothetical protein VJN43_08535 [Bryobacteraceae bacterium]|nr:hypothetical protein [Bryobacteraceae bacterium]